MPTTPQSAAGWRIEPPVSVPIAAGQSRAATAAVEPPELPPGTSGAAAPAGVQGLIVGSNQLVTVDEPIANSSRLVLPISTAPASQSLAVTVDS